MDDHKVHLLVGIFLWTTIPRPALEPTQPPIRWVLGILSWS